MPLSMCHGDATRRRTNKSKLMEVLIIGVESLDKSVLASFPKDVLLVDLIALINTMVFEFPSTYQEFTQKLMQRIPKNYKRADILADDYKNKANSLKLSEQAKLHHLTEFRTKILRNNENKARLTELILKHIKEQNDECLNLLNSDTTVFSIEDKYFLLIFAGISNITELETSNEEADTKIIPHTMHLREAHNVGNKAKGLHIRR